jgi:hypothetical protein
MRRALLAGSAVVLVVTLGALGYAVHLVRKLDTPEFQRTLLDRIGAAVGTDVRARKVEISLLSGVTLEEPAIANPAPFTGDLLGAEAFTLRYRLLPLLAGRVEFERIALDRPRLALAMDARGVFNYERLGKAAAPARAAAAPAGVAAVPLRLVLRQLSVEHASIVMTDHTKDRLLAIEDASFRSAFEIEGGLARGSGTARLGTVELARRLFVRDVRSPLSMSRKTVTLAPARGRMAGGQVTGDLTIHLEGGLRWDANLEAKDADVKTLAAEAGSAGGLAGALAAKATLSGSGGLASLRGRGQATIGACRAENARALALLAGVLRLPELADPSFHECRFELLLTGSRLAMPVVSLRGDALRITGRGTVDLATSGLDYQLKLALAPRLFAKLTRPEVRAAFQLADDGFAGVEFRLHGTTTAPRTDLASRLGKAAATATAKDQLNKLLGKKIF